MISHVELASQILIPIKVVWLGGNRATDIGIMPVYFFLSSIVKLTYN